LYFKSERQANPYHYGIIPEITIKADGSYSVVLYQSSNDGYNFLSLIRASSVLNCQSVLTAR